MVVAKPSFPSSTAPFCRDYNQIESFGRFDFEPFLASMTWRIIAIQGFRHKTFMSSLERIFQEAFRLLSIRSNYSRCKQGSGCKVCEQAPSFRIRLINEFFPFKEKYVKEVELERDLSL